MWKPAKSKSRQQERREKNDREPFQVFKRHFSGKSLVVTANLHLKPSFASNQSDDCPSGMYLSVTLVINKMSVTICK